MYRLTITPDDLAKAYVQKLYRALNYVLPLSPKASVTEYQDRIVFKYTGIGSKYTHHVYVEFKPMPNERCAVIVARPAYPMYLLAVMSPLSTVSYPSIVLRVGEEVRGLLVESLEVALNLVSSALTRYKLIDPGFVDEETGFEGLLYSTPAGYVAFTKERSEFELVDTIEGHVEDDSPDALTPVEYFAGRFPHLWVQNLE